MFVACHSYFKFPRYSRQCFICKPNDTVLFSGFLCPGQLVILVWAHPDVCKTPVYKMSLDESVRLINQPPVFEAASVFAEDLLHVSWPP